MIREPDPVAPLASGADVPAPASGALSRAAVIDAAARVVAQRGDHRVRWSQVAFEVGNADALRAADGFQDMPALLDECYGRAAEGLEKSLLNAETAPGTALDRIAAFLVAALDTRRERGSLLSFRRGGDLPSAQQKRLRERDMMVRTRLKRLLARGRRDGSLAMWSPDSACELILACLQAPQVTVDSLEQRMRDSELVELLLAALAEPHPAVTEPDSKVAVATGSCLCGAVRYRIEGPIEVMSHCHCSMCRKHHGSAFATFVTVPVGRYQLLSGAESMTTYQSSPYGRRSFCSQCGSVTPVIEPDTGVVFCPAGNLEGDLGIKPQSHLFVGSKAPWHTITDGLPQEDEV